MTGSKTSVDFGSVIIRSDLYWGTRGSPAWTGVCESKLMLSSRVFALAEWAANSTLFDWSLVARFLIETSCSEQFVSVLYSVFNLAILVSNYLSAIVVTTSSDGRFSPFREGVVNREKLSWRFGLQGVARRLLFDSESCIPMPYINRLAAWSLLWERVVYYLVVSATTSRFCFGLLPLAFVFYYCRGEMTIFEADGFWICLRVTLLGVESSEPATDLFELSAAAFCAERVRICLILYQDSQFKGATRPKGARIILVYNTYQLYILWINFLRNLM